MKGFRNPPGFVCALFEVQEGLCFHCNKPMFFMKTPESVDKLLATREHLYPLSKTGYGMRNNVVLAHSYCNSVRGNPDEPTREEIAKAKIIYGLLGLTAFKQPPYTHGEDYRLAQVCTEARLRFSKETEKDVV